MRISICHSRMLLSGIQILVFLLNTLGPFNQAQADEFLLPKPGTMVTVSSAFSAAIITGMTIHPENPLQFDFIVDTGDDHLQGETLKKESQKLIDYFMATLTVPEDEMWVNLSPYEKNRIIAEGLGNTEMGRDMLAQDYILKQLTASLIHPESKLGKEFWQKIYTKAKEQFGTTEVPTNLFNKVWIVPQDATVYVNGKNVFVTGSHLKVMLEQDYLSLEKHNGQTVPYVQSQIQNVGLAGSQVVREIILPAIEKEVNEGKNFSNLRQIYNSMILATWYKKKLKNSLLSRIYLDQNETNGIELTDKNIKERIYRQYLSAYKKGVYNYIKEDYDAQTQVAIPRKYFSGGLERVRDVGETRPSNEWIIRQHTRDHAIVAVNANLLNRNVNDTAMLNTVRSDKEGFKWERKRYLVFAEAGDFFPEELEVTRHARPWPVDMSNPQMHITTYYGDNNYVDPRENKDHFAIDIQAPVGTDIHPVEDGIIIRISKDEQERYEGNSRPLGHMVDIDVYSPSSNTIWKYVHVDIESLSERMKKFMDEYVDPRMYRSDLAEKMGYKFDFESGIKVTTKDVIGKIVRWNLKGEPELADYVNVPSDVAKIYQRTFNHLHLSAQYVIGGREALNKISIDDMPHVNPTLLLRQLYSFDPKRISKGKKFSIRNVKSGATPQEWIDSLAIGEVVLATGDFSNEVFGLRTYDVNEALKKSPTMCRVQGERSVWIKEGKERFSNLENIITTLKYLSAWELDPGQSPGTQVQLNEIMTFSSSSRHVKEVISRYVQTRDDNDLFRILLLMDKTDNYEEVLRRYASLNGSDVKDVLNNASVRSFFAKATYPRAFAAIEGLERDFAMLEVNPGGIDLNADNLNLKEQGQGVDFNFSSNNFQNIRPNAVNGILPMIVGIITITDFSSLLQPAP